MLNVSDILRDMPCRTVNIAEDRACHGVYTGDLLSWVMSHAKCDNVFVTVMTNINVLAVATLTDVSLVVITDNSEIDEAVIKTAADKGVNMVQTSLSSYEVCVFLHEHGVDA